jgi:chorismate mutase
MLRLNGKKIIIAGPCALESREQLQLCRGLLQPLGIRAIRASLWKPRTQPGWDGLGESSLEVLLEETILHGLIPATEIISVEHAHHIVNVLRRFGSAVSILVWLGARNQNHIEQRRIARVLSSGSPCIHLMFKNQMWEDEKHWKGIYEHIKNAGFPPERLLVCHRGFAPGRMPNPDGFRNLPDFDMAMRIKQETGLPMILDPSHIGGSKENVFKIVKKSLSYNFDGYIVEVHHTPQEARTDKQQQLAPHEFEKLLKMIEPEQAWRETTDLSEFYGESNPKLKCC